MNPTSQREQRIRKELEQAGMTAFGFTKFTTHHLPEVLHDNEHIKGVVYGRYEAGTGLMRWEEGMMVATDRRVLFFDRKPGFNNLDELAYDAVSGVQKSYTWPFASVALHTRIRNYSLRFANKKCVDIFVEHVEKSRLEATSENNAATDADLDSNTSSKPKEAPMQSSPPHPATQQDGPLVIDNKTADFLNDHTVAALSSADSSGNSVAGAVYYRILTNGIMCTQAAHSPQNFIDTLGRILGTAPNDVTLVIYDQSTLQALYINGTATVLPPQPAAERALIRIIPKTLQLSDLDPAAQLSLLYTPS